ncbi:hypothetical protein BKA57DRAFT_522682, partial [Linnemannia elongata]
LLFHLHIISYILFAALSLSLFFCLLSLAPPPPPPPFLFFAPPPSRFFFFFFLFLYFLIHSLSLLLIFFPSPSPLLSSPSLPFFLSFKSQTHIHAPKKNCTSHHSSHTRNTTHPSRPIHTSNPLTMDKILHLGKKRSAKQSPPISISSPTPSPAGASPFYPSSSVAFVPQTTYQPRASVNLSPAEASVYSGSTYANSSNGSTYNGSSGNGGGNGGGSSSNSNSGGGGGGGHGYQSHSGDYSPSSPPLSAHRAHPNHYSASSSPYFGSVSAATANVIANFTSGHHRASSSHDRPTSPNNFDTQSIRSYRTSTSGTASEAGRAEALSMTRPRSDQEIEDRFVDVIVGAYDFSTILSCYVRLDPYMDELFVSLMLSQQSGYEQWTAE